MPPSERDTPKRRRGDRAGDGRRRRARHEAGLCTRCGRHRPPDDRSVCGPCRTARRATERVHKTANVLNKLPKSQHSKAKRALQEIWMAETRNHADSAFDAFIETDAVKYDKAAACLVKDRATMLAFYDFPAEHWKHLRTTNPIESTVATVRHRTVRSKGCLSNKTALAMVFKLAQAAQNSWRRLDGHNQLPKLIVGVKFIDGIEAVRQQPQAAA